MNAILKEAKRLHDLGWAIHWCKERGKMPVESGWTTGPRKSWADLESSYVDGFNVGVRPGSASKIGDNYLACIDVDVKDPDFRDAAHEALRHLIDTAVGGASCPEVSSGSGNGSSHFYVVTSEPFKMRTIHKVKDKWEICIYSEGRQMVLPPSIHPNGKPYRWNLPALGEPSLPLLALSLLPEPSLAEKKVRTPKATLHDFKLTNVNLDWLEVSEEMVTLIKEGVWKGVAINQSDYLLMAASALFKAGCEADDVLTVLTEPTYVLGSVGYRHRRTSSRADAASWLWDYTVKKVADEREAKRTMIRNVDDAPGRELTPNEAAKQEEEFLEDRPWTQELQTGDKGGVKLTLKNIDLILSNSVSPKIFVRDLFANRDSYGVDTPWGGKIAQHMNDMDLIKIRRWLSDTSFQMEPKKELTLDTVKLISDRNKFHPVRDWLDSLIWDGTPRISTWIKKYLKGEGEEPFLSEASRLFLIAMCKRVFVPGCQWDYILVLEGKQGTYKSSTARALAGDKWFMDNLPDLRDKDSMLNLQGKWIIELGELASTKRADYDSVKAYLSRRTDSVRSPYNHLPDDIPRQSVFIGTVNEGQYLKDPTGNRRFWPVKVGVCNVEAIVEVRDQLFAEAMHEFKQDRNIALKLSDKADRQATFHQDERRIDDEETEMRERLENFVSEQCLLTREERRIDFKKFLSRELFEFGGPWFNWAGKPYAKQTGAVALVAAGFIRRTTKGQKYWKWRGLEKDDDV